MADVKRTNYFDRQFLRARDFQDEQAYHLDQQRRHNRLLHTPGVAEGLVVSGSTGSTVVTVSPGVAVDAQGREIVLSDPSNLTMPTGQASVDVFISYREEPSDPSAEPGITGFTRITESPNLSVTPAGIAPAGALLLARVPLNSANGQINGAINNNVRTMASSSIIGDGAITEPKLANNAVSTRTIQDNAVNAAKILDGSVGNAELANNAVTAPKIADNAVTTPKIADTSVTNTKLADLSISTNKIQDAAITIGKIAPGAVSPNIGVTVTQGLANGVNIPIPLGFTKAECLFFAIPKFINTNNATQFVCSVDADGKVTAQPVGNVTATGVAIAKKGGW